MRKLLHVASLLLLFPSFSSISFQDSYESVASTPPAPDGIELIAINKPFSICMLDGLPRQFCQSVSINLYGETYNTYALTDRLPVNPDLAGVQLILNTFSLGVDNAKYNLPTPGQLIALFNDNIEPRETGCYWINDPVLGINIAGYNTNSCSGTTAKVARIVTEDYPSACPPSNTTCGLRYKTVTLRLVMGGGWNASIKNGFYVKYNGRASELYTMNQNTERTITFPKGAINISVNSAIDGVWSYGEEKTNIEQRAGNCFVAKVFADGRNWRFTVDRCP